MAWDDIKVDGVTDILADDHNGVVAYAKAIIASKGQPSGIAPLDETARLSATYLPTSISGFIEYKGTFDAASGYPTSPVTGYYYVCSGAGTIGPVSFAVVPSVFPEIDGIVVVNV